MEADKGTPACHPFKTASCSIQNPSPPSRERLFCLFLPQSVHCSAHLASDIMGKKAVKSTRKFAASGQLKKTIQARKKHQEIRRKTQGKKGGRKDVKGKQPQAAAAADGEEDEEETASPPRSGKGKLK